MEHSYKQYRALRDFNHVSVTLLCLGSEKKFSFPFNVNLKKYKFLGDQVGLRDCQNCKPPYSKLLQNFLLGDVHVGDHNSYPPGSLLRC